MIKSTFTLPEGYRAIRKLDLQHDKKAFMLVNGISLAIMAAMCAAGVWLGPGFSMDVWACLFVLAATVVYLIAHEAVHGVCIRLYCGKWGGFGFTGAYAYASSDAYFASKPYAVIALAPVVVWGVVFAVACAAFPAFFWPVYVLQIVNISGAAGDFYVFFLLRRMPKDVLVRDSGTSMEFFTRQ